MITAEEKSKNLVMNRNRQIRSSPVEKLFTFLIYGILGILGASFGAYAEYISVIGDNFDLAAWYTFCGGGGIDPGYLVSSWEAAGTKELPLRLLYIAEGEYDDRYAPESSYHNLLYYGKNVEGFFSEENVRYTMIQGWGHEDHSYLVGLFNTLQLFFRD